MPTTGVIKQLRQYGWFRSARSRSCTSSCTLSVTCGSLSIICSFLDHCLHIFTLSVRCVVESRIGAKLCCRAEQRKPLLSKRQEVAENVAREKTPCSQPKEEEATQRRDSRETSQKMGRETISPMQKKTLKIRTRRSA